MILSSFHSICLHQDVPLLPLAVEEKSEICITDMDRIICKRCVDEGVLVSES